MFVHKSVFYSFVVSSIFILLTGCTSKEAKQYIQTDEFKSQIEEIIIAQGITEYDLELKVDTGNLKFGWENGLPIRSDDIVKIPVVTVVDPVYRFDATAYLDHQNGKGFTLGDVDIETRGLGDLGQILLTDLFTKAYEENLTKLLKLDVKAEIKDIKVLAKRSTFIADENENREAAFLLTADYKAGNFKDVIQIEEMMDKHMYKEEPNEKRYLPEISIELLETYKQENMNEERFKTFITNLKADEDLPEGSYIVHFNPESEEKRFMEIIEVIHQQ